MEWHWIQKEFYMKIATFNANSIRSRLQIILLWLKKNDPDVLCIQETKVQDHMFPAEEFTKAGYHVEFKGEKSYNGVSLISRKKPSQVKFGFDDGGPADETRLLYAKVGSVDIVNTYVYRVGLEGFDCERRKYCFFI